MVIFLRLEKIQFGGTKGQSLSDLVEAMFNEFNDLMNAFVSRLEDPLDISNNVSQPSMIDQTPQTKFSLLLQKFTTEYSNYVSKLTDMEIRLAHIVCQAFDECGGCESAFKLFEMMGPLLERPIIQKDFQYKYPILLSMYSEELDQAKVIFDRQMERMQSASGPVINKNMPRVAGLLKWAQELKERIGMGMEKLKQINHG